MDYINCVLIGVLIVVMASVVVAFYEPKEGR